MATTRIKDLSKTATTVASDANIVIDGSSNGTQKITRDNFRQDTADAFVAAPSTYKLAPLNGVNKIDATYLPTSSDTPKGEWNASSNSPALADGSGVAGDYYDVTTAGTQNLGSGSIIFTVGDVVKYNGSTWFKIDSVANILDGSATAADGRSALSVNSKDEDAQANALKTTAPSMYFNGTSSVVTVADDDRFSFTDGVDDLPFAISAFVKMSDATNNGIVAKYGPTAANREWSFRTDATNKLVLQVIDTSGNSESRVSDSALDGYEGQWIHVAACYGGSGPNSASAFTSAADEITLYVNGQAVAATESSSGTYTGMSNTSQAVWIGQHSSSTFAMNGSIRDAKIFNRELTSTEIAQLARGNDLGFSEEWGGANGGLGTIDETVGVSSWTGSGSITLNNITETANTTVGARANVLKLEATATGSSTTRMYMSTALEGKRERISFDLYIPSSNVTIDKVLVLHSSGSTLINTTLKDTWSRFEVEHVNDGTSVLQLQLIDGSIYNPTAGDYIGIDNFSVTQIGTLADFRAEDYNESASKLLDRSSNNFVGVGTSVTLTGNQRHISADTIDLKNLPTSSAGLSAGEVWSNGGVLTVV